MLLRCSVFSGLIRWRQFLLFGSQVGSISAFILKASIIQISPTWKDEEIDRGHSSRTANDSRELPVLLALQLLRVARNPEVADHVSIAQRPQKKQKKHSGQWQSVITQTATNSRTQPSSSSTQSHDSRKINLAYEILENDYTRNAYNSFLIDPSGSRAYHTYQYYRASYSPQVNPFFVIFMLLVLLSWLQWVMRNQMYASAVENIVNSENFRKRVNEQCISDGRKGDKRYKEEVAERLEKEISIQGGYSKPEIKDMLFCQFFLLPYTLALWIKSTVRWIWKYYIRRQEYDETDQSEITRRALKAPKAQWQSLPSSMKQQYISRKLWIKQNMIKYREEMQQKQLEQLKESNPAKYRKIMSYLKKQQ